MADGPVELKAGLEKLPRWAVVAFAARCARRVQPLFDEWKDGTQEQRKAVEAAILVAERAAAAGRSPTDAEADAGGHYSGAADAAAAAHAARSSVDMPISAAVGAAEAAASFSLRAARGVAGAEQATLDAVARDIGLLRDRAAKEGWTEETPVPPEFFGPMWPGGPPAGWPQAAHLTVKPGVVELKGGAENKVEASATLHGESLQGVSSARAGLHEAVEGRSTAEGSGPVTDAGSGSDAVTVEKEVAAGDAELVVEFEVPDDVPDDEIIQRAEEAAVLLDDLYRALGGSGLRVKSIEAHEDSRVPAEAP